MILLGGIFLVIFWLLYSLGSFFYENQKRQEAIELIREQNERTTQEIDDKKRYLAYLQTEQRIDKEAKMQMNKKQPNEEVLVFVEEKLDFIASETLLGGGNAVDPLILENVAPIERWKWLLFGK